MEDLVKSLRALPMVKPPGDLTQRIMAALPRHRGVLGHLEWALRSGARRRPAGRTGNLLLPSSPEELGLFFLSAGVFFLCLAFSILLRLHLFGSAFDLSGPVVFFLPVLTASLFLILAGWNQIRSPGKVTLNRPRLLAACGLFTLTVVLGLASNSLPGSTLIVTWLGVSGLMVAGALVLIRERLPQTLPGEFNGSPQH